MNLIQNEKWVEELPEEIIRIFQEINIDIIIVICNRINTIGNLSRSDIIKLTNAVQFLGADMDKIESLISDLTKKSEGQIKQIFEKAAKANDDFAKVFYEARGLTSVSYETDNVLKNMADFIAEQTNYTFKNLSNTTLYFKVENGQLITISEMYKRAVDKAIYEVQSGTVDFNTAMRKTVRQLGDGLYVYESGRKQRLDTAARMNILDGVRKLNQEYLNYHGKKFGADGVELSAHAISAPDHAPVQGHQFSNAEFAKMQNGESCIDVNGVVYDGFPRPIGEWNCKHITFPIVIGITSPAYSEKQLAEMQKNSKEKYDLTQKQRNYELNLRKLKSLRVSQSAAGDTVQARETQMKINKLQAEYKRFCITNNLTYQPNRGSVPGYKRMSL